MPPAAKRPVPPACGCLPGNMRVPAREHERPALYRGGKGINVRRRTGSKGEMVQTRPAPLMRACYIGPGLQDDVLPRALPAASVPPFGFKPVAQLFQEPAQAAPCPRVVLHPDLDMVEAPRGRIRHTQPHSSERTRMAPESGQKTIVSALAFLMSARSPALSCMPEPSDFPWKSRAAPTPYLARDRS